MLTVTALRGAMDIPLLTHIRRLAAPVALVTLLLLLVPLVAMQVSSEVDWRPGDFTAAGVLLFSAGLAGALSVKRIRDPWRRAAAVAGVVATFLLVWAELAVGLFD